MKGIKSLASLGQTYRSYRQAQQDLYNYELAKKVIYANNKMLTLTIARRAVEKAAAKERDEAELLEWLIAFEKQQDSEAEAACVDYLKSIGIYPPPPNEKDSIKDYSQQQLIGMGIGKATVTEWFDARAIIGIHSFTRKGNIKARLSYTQIKKIIYLNKAEVAKATEAKKIKYCREIATTLDKQTIKQLLRFEILILYGNLFGRHNGDDRQWDTFFDDTWNKGAMFYLKRLTMPPEANDHELELAQWDQRQEEYWRIRLNDYLNTPSNDSTENENEKELVARNLMERLCIFLDKMFMSIYHVPRGMGENIEVISPIALASVISKYYTEARSNMVQIVDFCPGSIGPGDTILLIQAIDDVLEALYTKLGQKALKLHARVFARPLVIADFTALIKLIPAGQALLTTAQSRLKKVIDNLSYIDGVHKDKLYADIVEAIYSTGPKQDITTISKQLISIMHTYTVDTFSVSKVLADEAYADLCPTGYIDFVDLLDVDRLVLLKYILIITAFAMASPTNVDKLSYLVGKVYESRKTDNRKTRVQLLSTRNLAYLLGYSDAKVRRLMIYGDEMKRIADIHKDCKKLIVKD